MSEANWQKVRRVFDAALQQEPEERLAYITEACGDDKDLLTEVESLLSSLKSDAFLEIPAVAHVSEMIVTSTKSRPWGTRFGHYELIRQIGVGGTGEVYLAKDQKLDRLVGIKILNEDFSREGTNIERFAREAKAASALNHPNILVIHEVGESEGAHYIVSEFIEGRTLRELAQSQMSLKEIVGISIQIANALSAAHDAHLVHRDIKPENVMVRPDGYVKVLDFGLAKLVAQGDKAVIGLDGATGNQTAKGVILGTVNYMSPEQAKGEPVDQRTDIFSFGVVLYEMLAGRVPFAGGSLSETFANLINAEPQSLSDSVSNVPDELTRIVAKTLRKKTDERYQSMKDVLTDLEDLKLNLTLENRLERSLRLGQLKATASLLATTNNAAEQRARTKGGLSLTVGRHKRVSAFMAVSLIVGVVALGYHFFYSTKTASNVIAKRGTENDDAYRLYLQGISLYDKRTLAETQKAVGILEQAIQLDPNYAWAWALKAHVHRALGNFGGNPRVEYEKSMEAINHALALNPNLADSYSALCENKLFYEWDFDGAERECKRAIELDVNSARAHDMYARYLYSRGRFDEAIAEIKTAIDIDPTQLFIQRNYGVSLFYARRYTEAITQFKRVLEIDPNFVATYAWFVPALNVQGNEAEAFEWFIKWQGVLKTDEETVQAYKKAYQTSGWHGVGRERVKRFDELKIRSYFLETCLTVHTGDKDKAFEYLEKSYQRREWGMSYLQVDPSLDGLRADPRFGELVRRVALK
jgi:serine/threonine protein kinase/Tfp pilus assembly protein PilF